MIKERLWKSYGLFKREFDEDPIKRGKHGYIAKKKIKQIE